MTKWRVCAVGVVLLGAMLLACLPVGMAGCGRMYVQPTTGQTYTEQQAAALPTGERATLEKVTVLEQQTVAAIDTAADITEKIGPVATATASAIWPVLIPILTLIAGIVAGGIGYWRKIKPSLTGAQSREIKYYNVTAGLVSAVEMFKAKYPEHWASLESQIAEAIGPEAENVIRAIRSLPPKQ